MLPKCSARDHVPGLKIVYRLIFMYKSKQRENSCHVGYVDVKGHTPCTLVQMVTEPSWNSASLVVSSKNMCSEKFKLFCLCSIVMIFMSGISFSTLINQICINKLYIWKFEQATRKSEDVKNIN